MAQIVQLYERPKKTKAYRFYDKILEITCDLNITNIIVYVAKRFLQYGFLTKLSFVTSICVT